MDDLQSKLAGILNDPESMERVRKMAENLFSGEKNGSSVQNNPPANSGNMPSGEELQMIMSVVSKLNSAKDSERTNLITALKPYLSDTRREKAENAIKILKLLEILPLLKDSGLFKF